jgi:hypothetical protein
MFAVCRLALLSMSGSPISASSTAAISAGPVSHFGFAVPSREAVDAIASEAKDAGLLQFGPMFLNPYAGYLCILNDPDGHHVEFSHGQSLGIWRDGAESAGPHR